VRYGGIAAVPLNQHGHPVSQRDADWVPLCPVGLRMQPTYQFNRTRGYRAEATSAVPCSFPNRQEPAASRSSSLKA
jgi:hypothetical protein